MKVPPFVKKTLQVVLPLLVGGVILWFLYKDTNFSSLYHTLRYGSNYWIIALSLIFGLAANTVRGLRWDILIRSLGKTSSKKNAILTTHGNYAVNMALPRMGEVWRCGAMSHYSGIGFSELFGTLLIDRAFDFVMVALIFAFCSLYNLAFFQTFFENNPDLIETMQHVVSSPVLYLVLLLFVGGLFIVFRFFRHTNLVQKGISFLKDVWSGLKTVWTMEDKWGFIIYSFLLWGGYFLFFYTTFYAFEFTRDLGPNVGLIAFLMGSIAVAAPVQAGMGAWHFMVIYTLVAFGVGRDNAASFALIVHTIQTLWTTLCGLIALGLLPVLNKGKAPKQTDASLSVTGS